MESVADLEEFFHIGDDVYELEFEHDGFAIDGIEYAVEVMEGRGEEGGDIEVDGDGGTESGVVMASEESEDSCIEKACEV